MEFLILLVLVGILVALLSGQPWRTADRRQLQPAARALPRAQQVSRREHALGIRPCSQPGCASCRVYVARLDPHRQRWDPVGSGPRAVDGTLSAVEHVRRYDTDVPLYYLDPMVVGGEAWVVEGSHKVLAGELARFAIGDRLRIEFQGSRVSRSSGYDYYHYEVRQLL